jgi:hypothetical protein
MHRLFLFNIFFRVGHSYPFNTNQIRKPINRQWSYDYGQSSVPSYPHANIPSAPMFDTDLVSNAAASFKHQLPNIEQTTVNDQQNY